MIDRGIWDHDFYKNLSKLFKKKLKIGFRDYLIRRGVWDYDSIGTVSSNRI